jgi:hypothetical protein
MAASLIQQGHSGRFKAGRLPVVGQIVARVEVIAGVFMTYACSPWFTCRTSSLSTPALAANTDEQA